jgi:hypothetical protein
MPLVLSGSATRQRKGKPRGAPLPHVYRCTIDQALPHWRQLARLLHVEKTTHRSRAVAAEGDCAEPALWARAVAVKLHRAPSPPAVLGAE